MKINLTLEITPEEIFSMGELLEHKLAQRVMSELNLHPIPASDSKTELWTGKSVKIRQITPDSVIDGWNKRLQRDIVYGVAMEDPKAGMIEIQDRWYKKIWFELVS